MNATPQTQKKKITIQAFKVAPKVPESFETDAWKKLQEAINAIFEQQVVKYSQEELYKSVEGLCIHQKAPELFKNFTSQCKINIDRILTTLLGVTTDQTSYLRLISKTWTDFCVEMLMIRNIFLYLDRTFVITNSQVKSLWDLGLSLFRQIVADNVEVSSKVEKSILDLLERERSGDSIERNTFKTNIQMMIQLEIFTKFEKIVLDKTSQYYTLEARKTFQELHIPEYLVHVENRIHQEAERCESLFTPETKRLVIQLLEEKLIKDYTSQILSKGFESLVSQHRLTDLSRLYKLFIKTLSLKDLFVCFYDYIKKTGNLIVSDSDGEKNLIPTILEFKNKVDTIYHTCFEGNEAYSFEYRQSFEKFINSNGRVAELIAKFVDGKLKGASKLTETELEKTMDDSIVLFKFLDSKDVFEQYYKKDLAKRLLLGKSASIEMEKLMITKLKNESGNNFTSKLESMFKDMELSKGMMQEFKTKHDKMEIDLTVTVITTGNWPPYSDNPVKLYKEIALVQDVFKTFYLEKFVGRTLKWQNGISQCTLKATFGSGAKELLVSAYQGIILLLFNDVDQLSVKEIKEATGIDDKELNRNLLSLVTDQVPVLKRNGQEEEEEELKNDTVFAFNQAFSHKLFRIQINQIQVKETVEEKQQTDEKIIQDRQYAIDACIVRIMKSRRQLTHNSLVSEVFGQLKFPMKNTDVKKRIESLIERDYLTREGAGVETLYVYQA